jgi:hypothetical protein
LPKSPWDTHSIPLPICFISLSLLGFLLIYCCILLSVVIQPQPLRSLFSSRSNLNLLRLYSIIQLDSFTFRIVLPASLSFTCLHPSTLYRVCGISTQLVNYFTRLAGTWEIPSFDGSATTLAHLQATSQLQVSLFSRALKDHFLGLLTLYRL